MRSSINLRDRVLQDSREDLMVYVQPEFRSHSCHTARCMLEKKRDGDSNTCVQRVRRGAEILRDGSTSQDKKERQRASLSCLRFTKGNGQRLTLKRVCLSVSLHNSPLKLSSPFFARGINSAPVRDKRYGTEDLVRRTVLIRAVNVFTRSRVGSV